jgi:hypothetical protein
MFPLARTDRLTVRELAGETLVYDHQRHKAHCLNAAAALVWRRCDGKTSLDELARLVGGGAGEGPARAVLDLALEQLHRRGLLEGPPPAVADRASRREALKRLALAAACLPLVLTVTTRTAAQSMSDGGGGGGSSSSDSSTPAVSVTANVAVVAGPAAKAAPAPTPCRTRGQSCVASASGQQGTCCAGLACNGVAQGAGVCG